MSEGRRLIDVSHVVEHGMVTYHGLPAPVVCDYLSRADSRSHYAPGVEFHIGKVKMVANTGTYLDAPFHRYADGSDLAGLPLTRLADLDAVVVRWDLDHGRAMTAAAFRSHDVRGKAVLVHTGWDAHWRTDRYLEGHPFLTADAAAWLRDEGATLVGIDSLNIDDTADLARPVHSSLLRADIPIVEHLRGLEQLAEAGFRFFAVPVKFRGMGRSTRPSPGILVPNNSGIPSPRAAVRQSPIDANRLFFDFDAAAPGGRGGASIRVDPGQGLVSIDGVHRNVSLPARSTGGLLAEGTEQFGMPRPTILEGCNVERSTASVLAAGGNGQGTLIGNMVELQRGQQAYDRFISQRARWRGWRAWCRTRRMRERSLPYRVDRRCQEHESCRSMRT